MITIIGSGFGAFGVVKELVEKSIKVRVITSTFYEDINEAGTSFNMPSVQAAGLGGTSNIWGGGFAPMEKSDFKNWQINYEDILPYYHEVANYFKFSFNKFETKNHDKKIRHQINHVEYDKSKLINKWFLIPLPIIRLKSYFEKWRHEGKIEIIKDKVIKVDFKKKYALSKKNKYKYSKIIIACGCLNSAKILYDSGIVNKNLGRYLSDHPKLYFASLKLKKPMPKHSVYAFMKYKDDVGVQIKTGLILKKPINNQNHNIYFKPLFIDVETTKKIEKLGTKIWTLQRKIFKPHNLLHLIKNFKTLVLGALYKYNLFQKYSKVGLFAILENQPFYESKLDLSKPSTVNYQISKSEVDKYLKYFDFIKNLFGKDCRLIIKSREEFYKNVSSAAHFTGTTRMAKSVNHGVVDLNLKLFNIDDAYVCDGGVFPSNGNANISMTILALSFKLGKMIYEELN